MKFSGLKLILRKNYKKYRGLNIMLGVFVNVLTVILGSTIGLVLKKGISE